MKSNSFHIIHFCLLGLVFALSSCIDDPVRPDNYLIKGKIYGGYNLLVSAGDYPIVSTDRLGNFEVEALSKPYNLIIDERSLGIVGGNSYLTLKFLDLTINNPQIVLNDWYSGYTSYNNYENCDVNIIFPELNEKKIVCTKFISKSKFYQSRYWQYLDPGEHFKNTDIFIPSDEPSISGKMYYLEIKMDTMSGEFLSYDKFAIKDITLEKGLNPDIIFTPKEMNNPEEYLMEIRMDLPQDLNNFSTKISLSCQFKNKESDLELTGGLYTEFEYFNIPILPGNDFNIKLYNEYGNSYLQDISLGTRCMYVNPGEPAYFPYKETVSLVSPPVEYENVSDSTTFEISDNEEPAIYEFNIFSYQIRGYFKFYTNKKRGTLADFNARGYHINKNTTYFWAVRKFPNYTSLDEFISQPYPVDDRYDYIELSKSQSFKTAP